MTKFRISGVWKDSNGVITHYAFHNVYGNKTTGAKKISKIEALRLLEENNNSAYTLVWDYSKALWIIGEKVEIIKSRKEKYLRSDPDNTLTNNLEHLIDFTWMTTLY
jgi:hypothetical protein